jgi:hypothetical protein
MLALLVRRTTKAVRLSYVTLFLARLLDPSCCHSPAKLRRHQTPNKLGLLTVSSSWAVSGILPLPSASSKSFSLFLAATQ